MRVKVVENSRVGKSTGSEEAIDKPTYVSLDGNGS